MTLEEWDTQTAKNPTTLAAKAVRCAIADWKAEREKLIGALEEAEKLLMEVDDVGCADANATGLAYCGKCLSCRANDLVSEIDDVLEIRGKK